MGIPENAITVLFGPSGGGKSTLLRIVAGVENFEGNRVWGNNVDESFYAQHQLEALNINNTILDEMKEAGSKKTEPELRALLGCFLFSGDDTDKKIRVLSGGEKARVALAKTIVSKANFLMLDEPTNHLDMHSVELLADALNKYEGSIILVSHDRFFISKTANKIWEIVNNEIKEFKGTYTEWVEWNERMEARRKQDEKAGKSDNKPEEKKTIDPPKNTAPAVAKTAQQIPAKPNAPINRELQRDLQKNQRQLQNLEAEVTRATNDKLRLEAAMAAPENYADRNKFAAVEKEYEQVKQKLTTLNNDYEALFEKVLELEAQTS